MTVLGAHRISVERGYTVHRNSGLLTIAGTLAFASAILTTQGKIVATPGWAPFLDWTNGYLLVGGVLLLSGLLGVAGLAFDDGDRHVLPRVLTLISAFIGAAWFITAAVAFCFAYASGWINSGPFLAIPAAVLHLNRFVLLAEFPRR